METLKNDFVLIKNVKKIPEEMLYMSHITKDQYIEFFVKDMCKEFVKYMFENKLFTVKETSDTMEVSLIAVGNNHDENVDTFNRLVVANNNLREELRELKANYRKFLYDFKLMHDDMQTLLTVSKL